MNKNGLCIYSLEGQIMALSNKYNAELVTVTNRRGQVKEKPRQIYLVYFNTRSKYTKYMKPIDHHDQMLAYYTCEHKSLRWYKKVIIHLMEVMKINAFLLYKNHCRQTTYYNFKISVVKSLVAHDTLKLNLPLG